MEKSNFVIFTPEYRPQLFWSIMIPCFQQWTGINAIMFYCAPLFKTLGFGQSTALLNAVIMGVVNMLATIVSIVLADRVGRRVLFIQGGFQMLACQVAIGAILAGTFHDTNTLGQTPALLVLILICGYVAAFAWSWGALGWAVPAEMQTLETRAMGQAITVAVKFLFTFIVGQSFISMLCAMEYGTFFFFAGCVAVMTACVYFLLPETKGVPIEGMKAIWRAHRVWARILPTSDSHTPTV